MIFTTQMSQLFAVVLERDKERVTKTLLREGVMQFLTTSELEAQGPDKAVSDKPDASREEVTDLRKRVEGLLHTVGTIADPPNESDLSQPAAIDIRKETRELDQLDSEREGIRERQRLLQQEILKYEDIQRQVRVSNINLSNVTLPTTQSLLSTHLGKLPATHVKQLESGLKGLTVLNIPVGQDEDTSQHLLIFMARDKQKVKKILSSVHWMEMDLPDKLPSAEKEVTEELSVKLKKLKDEQEALQKKVTRIVKDREKSLVELWRNLRVLELCKKIEGHFNTSSRTIIFAGWLPSTKVSKLDEKISEACEGRCYLEWHNAEENKEIIGSDIPIQFKNPDVLAPFQMLVSNFGVPQYGTIDPTLFVMPLYLAMFGLMFADAGQGLVLALLGAWGFFRFKERKEKAGLARLFCLIIWCGIASILFGILFGSYFGFSYNPIWFDFHGIVLGHSSGNAVITDVYDILMITIFFGIAVISLGLVFNWINMIRTKNWADLIFDKGGLLGGWIYGGGIYIAYYMATHNYNGFPSTALLWLLAGIPAVLLFIKAPYYHMKHRHGSSKNENPVFLVLNFCMEWVVELLEIFAGYLSNTLSFMRVAGLGIAHVSLMVAFFSMAEMTSGIFSVLILIFGNLLVIALEGLSAGIQALRLNYYEFFTKFFNGTGKLHTPISLNSKL